MQPLPCEAFLAEQGQVAPVPSREWRLARRRVQTHLATRGGAWRACGPVWGEGVVLSSPSLPPTHPACLVFPAQGVEVEGRKVQLQLKHPVHATPPVARAPNGPRSRPL